MGQNHSVIETAREQKNRLLGVATFFGVFILFHSVFELQITKWVVNPLFSKVGENLLVDAVFVLINLLIVMSLALRLKRGYVVSTTRLSWGVPLLIIYLYYRIIGSTWCFKAFSFCDDWKYLDFLALYCFGFILLYLYHSFRKKKFSKSGTLAFVVDEPIINQKEDALGRKIIAEDLAKRIENTNSGFSIAVGVTGKWGSGKTSFLNLLKKSIAEDDTIKIDFNPWQSLNREFLIRDFFNTLGTHLDQFGTNLSSELSDYARELLNVHDSSVSRTINSTLSFFETTDVQQQFNKINRALDRLDKQVIVFIDDVDRLDKDEVVEVLKLIRNTGKFNKIKFVVAFDREYVIQSINAASVFNSPSYIDKIFLQITNLPPIHFVHLQSMLRNELVDRFQDKEKEITKSLVDRIFNSTHFAKNVITSVRDVKRFLNYFIPEYAQMQNEVNFDDYLKIKLLKYKFPTVYWELYLNSSDYLEADNGYQVLKKPAKNSTAPYVLEAVLQSAPNKFSLDNEEIKSAIELTESVFSRNNYNVHYSKGHLSIRHGLQFSKYFKNRLDSNDFSEDEFIKYINKPLDELKVQIKYWVSENKKFMLMERLKKFRMHEVDTRVEYEKIIKAIFYLGTLRNTHDSDSLIGYGYYNDDLYNKLYDGDGKEISKKYYDGDQLAYRKFLLDLFRKSESPYPLTASFAHWMIKHDRDGLPISVDEFKNIVISYFETHLSSLTEFSNKHTWNLYHCCIDVHVEHTRSNSRRITTSKNEKANKLFIDFIKKKGLDGFLLAVVDDHHRTEEGYYFVSSVVGDIFGSYEKFHDFVKNLDSEKSNYLKEFLDFMSAIENNGYSQYVPFEFKIIPVRSKRNIE